MGILGLFFTAVSVSGVKLKWTYDVTHDEWSFVCLKFLQINVLDEICDDGEKASEEGRRGLRVRRLCYLCGWST
jgi:hypothetical protein